MQKKDIFFLGVALVISLLVAFMARFLFFRPQIIQPPVQEKTKTVDVLTAPQTLYPGAKIDVSQLSWIAWPAEGLDEGFITRDSPKLEKIKGATVRHLILKGSPIRTEKLMHLNDKSILATVIAPTKRAFTMSVDGNAISHRISPGDYVDILVPGETGRGLVGMGLNQEIPKAKTVLRRVRVVAVNNNLEQAVGSGPFGLPDSPRTLTLEVTPEEAEKLAMAISNGSYSITIHSFQSEPEKFDPKGNLVPVPKKREIIVIRGIPEGTGQDGAAGVDGFPGGAMPFQGRGLNESLKRFF